ncbi:MAG: Tol-Pal system beta propeller repeat protein TolB [Proteobacteria bacterium]|nr:Tol-Pal system beta propeller repeat protein TolB [Pseudomonadota bacterium]
MTLLRYVDRIVNIKMLGLVVIVMMSSSICFGDDNGYITISNPFTRKAPLAVPLLMTMSKSKVEERLSAEACKTLSSLLEFTGYFKLIDHAAFLENPGVKGIDVFKINFRNWTMIGSELLVTGSILEKNGDVTIEFYLYDTFREQQLVAKRYKGSDKSIRDICRRFGTEIIRKFTGSQGLFHSKIAFVSSGTGNKEIYICEFDGENPVKVTNTKSITLSPAWSSDGTQLAYTSYEKGKPDIFIKNLGRGNVTLLTAMTGTNITPAWVPGKHDLAASLSFEGGQGIYLLTREGKIRKRITSKWSEWGIDVSPSFSPDGDNMAFVSKRSGTPQIYMQHMDSGRVKRLTYQGKYNTSPSWSPTGQKIAYSGVSESKFEIYVMDLKTGEVEQLTREAGDNESPSWSPDGSMIAFSSSREGYTRIYVMTSSGTDQRRLLFLSGEQTNPKWSPNIFNN